MKTNLSSLSPFALRMLRALQRLTKERVQHLCGGFTTDDMQWQMGVAFTPYQVLEDSIEALRGAGFLRCEGFDDNDAIGTCYGLTVEGRNA